MQNKFRIYMCFSAGHGVTFSFSRKRTNEVISSLFTQITGIYSSQRVALTDYYRLNKYSLQECNSSKLCLWSNGPYLAIMLWFVPKSYSDTRFSPIKIAFIFTAGLKPQSPFQIKRLVPYSFSLLYFFYLGMDAMVFSVATVKLLLGFIELNLYLM